MTPQKPAKKKKAIKSKKQSVILKSKKLEDYDRSKPYQLEFFEITEPENQHYSNTIELYDAIPKYVWRSQKRNATGNLQPLEREFVHKKNNYIVIIQPASIKQKDGNFIDIHPGQREELVEDALRKLACTGHGTFLDDHASVTFTLYQLQQELKKMGHTYNLNEIKEAITVCAKSNMELKTKDGQALFISTFFDTVGLKTQEDWKGFGKKTTAYIRFNPLVTESIKARSYRLLNYDKSMSYRRVLARWMHKRLSHNYIQASLREPYTIKLLTIIRDSGVNKYPSIRNNIVKVTEALDEMKEKQILSSFEMEKILDGRKIIDAKFTLYPHPSFVSEVVKSNKRKAQQSPQELEAFYKRHNLTSPKK